MKQTKTKRHPKAFKFRQTMIAGTVLVLVIASGIVILATSKAATGGVRVEPEGGNVMSPATVQTDSTASNGQAVVFKAPVTGNPGRTLRYMPLGDSITDGYGIAGAYRTVLWQKLVSQDKLAIDFVGSVANGPSSLGDKDHEGHGGWCIEAKCWDGTAGSNTIYQKITGWQSTYKPDIISIHLGTNDIGNNFDGISKGTTGAMVATRLDNLIARIYQNNPSASLIVCQIINMNSTYTYDRQMYEQYVAAIPGIVTKYKSQGRKIQLADMRYLLNYPADHKDGWHPNQSGYDKMGNFLYPLVKNAYNTF